MGTPLSPERGSAAQFSAHVYCAKRLDGWMKTPLGTEVDLGPGQIVLDGDPAPPHQKGHSSPPFLAHVYCGHGRPSQLLLSSCFSIEETPGVLTDQQKNRQPCLTMLLCNVGDFSSELADTTKASDFLCASVSHCELLVVRSCYMWACLVQ